MGIFELVVASASDRHGTVREVRSRCSLPVQEILRRIGSNEPVIVVSTHDYPLELDREDGLTHQHRAFLEAHEALRSQGGDVIVRYRPSEDWAPEVVALAIAKNLMTSELASARQEHD